MPQNKRPQLIYGEFHALLPAVKKCLAGQEWRFTGAEIKVLIAAATDPLFFSQVSFRNARQKVFGGMYARESGKVLEIMQAVRALREKQQATDAGKAKHFFLTHSYVMENGKGVPIVDKLDKEVASLLKIQTESVTTARKQLARKGAEIAKFSEPRNAAFLRTGRFPKLPNVRGKGGSGKPV